MRFIDTHTHLYLPEFDSDRDEAVERALSSGVEKMLLPNIDTASVNAMVRTEERYPGICYSMIGLHPTSVKEDFLRQLDSLEEKADSNRFIAVGEIGIDLYWDKTFIDEQIIAFRRQMVFAMQRDLPVVIHSRNAFPEVFAVLGDFEDTLPRGVFHAFTGTADDAMRAVEMGFKLGIGGIVTFKNSGLDKVVAEAGIENIIIETDSPYLAPTPHRGKRCESSYIPLINNRLADIFGIKPEECSEIIYNTSTELFNLQNV